MFQGKMRPGWILLSLLITVNARGGAEGCSYFVLGLFMNSS